MSQSYTPEFKKKIVALVLRKRTYLQEAATAEYGVYQKPVSPNGVLNSEKNDITMGRTNPDAPKKHMRTSERKPPSP